MSLVLGIQRSGMARAIARSILRLVGWRTQVIPLLSRYVLIGAPHTSNWDFIVALLLMAAESIPIRIMGKNSLFRGPMGVFMRSLGAIPVNRQEKTNLVDQIAERFDEYVISHRHFPRRNSQKNSPLAHRVLLYCTQSGCPHCDGIS